ncbi:MAG TPA: hypothetical protein PLC42_07800 [Parachlamydiaceae bacterium]|nr:hypothetical protein [Parachlamydiaceae bacterium]
MDSAPINSTYLPSFNRFLEGMNFYLERGDKSVASLFSETNESCSHTLRLENTMVVQVEECFLPDDIVKIIIAFSPKQLRLSLLPQVCRQFYNLCLPFSIECHRLRPLIPKVRDAVIPGITKTNFIVLRFQDNKITSIFKASFSPSKMSFRDYKVVWQEACEPLEDNFNFTKFEKKIQDLTGNPLISIAYKTFVNEDSSSFEFKKYHYQNINVHQVLARSINEFGNDFIEKLAIVMIRFGQKILLEGKDDFVDLKEILEKNCTTSEQLAILSLIKLFLLNNLEEEWKILKSVPEYQKIKESFLDNTTVSKDKLVVKIQQFVKAFDFEANVSKSLFFVDKFNCLINGNILRWFIPKNNAYSDVELWFAEQLSLL